MLVEPVVRRRATCAEHGLAVANDGGCVLCRRSAADPGEPRRGAGMAWPSLFVLGCLVAGLVGWQLAGNGPERLSVRPHYRMAVLTTEAQVPVAELKREARRPDRPAMAHRAEPSLGRPKGVHITVTEAEAQAMKAEAPQPVFASGIVRPPRQHAEPIEIQIAYASPREDPWRADMAPTPTPDRRRHRRARPGSGSRPGGGDRPQVFWRPPPHAFPGGGTGELWKPRARPTPPRRTATVRPNTVRPRPIRRARSSASRPRPLSSRAGSMASRAGSVRPRSLRARGR